MAATDESFADYLARTDREPKATPVPRSQLDKADESKSNWWDWIKKVGSGIEGVGEGIFKGINAAAFNIPSTLVKAVRNDPAGAMFAVAAGMFDNPLATKELEARTVRREQQAERQRATQAFTNLFKLTKPDISPDLAKAYAEAGFYDPKVAEQAMGIGLPRPQLIRIPGQSLMQRDPAGNITPVLGPDGNPIDIPPTGSPYVWSDLRGQFIPKPGAVSPPPETAPVPPPGAYDRNSGYYQGDLGPEGKVIVPKGTLSAPPAPPPALVGGGLQAVTPQGLKPRKDEPTVSDKPGVIYMNQKGEVAATVDPLMPATQARKAGYIPISQPVANTIQTGRQSLTMMKNMADVFAQLEAKGKMVKGGDIASVLGRMVLAGEQFAADPDLTLAAAQASEMIATQRSLGDKMRAIQAFEGALSIIKTGKAPYKALRQYFKQLDATIRSGAPVQLQNIYDSLPGATQMPEKPVAIPESVTTGDPLLDEHNR